MGRMWFWLGVVAMTLSSCGGGDDCEAGTPLFASAISKQQCNRGDSSGGGSAGVPKPAVVYAVSGTATRAFVTYSNRTGGTQQEEVQLPWSQAFQGIQGNSLYISAQNRDDVAGTIVVTISVDGITKKVSQSSGLYVIASTSDVCC